MKMKKIICFALLFSLPFGEGWGGVYAQNLVPNPSFEDTIHCPISPNGTYALNPFSVAQWINPCNTSPDYYNACAPRRIGANHNVPNNRPWAGWQYAHIGNAYVGIGIYSNGENFHEYIQAQLTSSLSINHKYCIEFYVNFCNDMNCPSNNIGLYLSDMPPIPNSLLYENFFWFTTSNQ
jgi:hypothetical protein